MIRYISFFFVSCFLFLNISLAMAEEISGAETYKDFIPHKALYDIELASTKSGAQIVNIKGQMLYEWEETCEAWNANHRFNLTYEYADNPPLQITSDFSTFETFDGKSFDFNATRKRDGELFEELRGNATFDELGKSGEAIFSKPNGLSFDLPDGTLFPMAHTLAVLEQMGAGKKFYSATIFDGSDDRGPVEVTAFIGAPENAMAMIEPSANIDTALLNSAAHKVRLAFFPLSEPSTIADYEMSLVLHDNGVVSDMFIEYEDFSVKQKLVALEKLESLCDGSPSPATFNSPKKP